MTWKSWVLTAIIAAACSPALADPLEDCARGRDAPARIAACTEIIKGASHSRAEKAQAHRNRGQARAAAGALEAAIADFSEALRLDPADAAAMAARGHARLGKGEIDAAIADLAGAVQLQPGNPAYLAGRGYARLVKGEPDHAISDLNEAIRLNPKLASSYNNRGLAWRKKGDIERAIEDFSAAIALNPSYAVAYNNRGYAYEAKGLKGEAIADFKRALNIDRSLVGAAVALKRLKAPGMLAAESDRLVREGQGLVEAHCSRCHAVGLTGQSPNLNAPAFRSLHRRHPVLALREPLSRGIAAPHDVMPQFVLPDQEVDKIIAYINSLSRGQSK